MKNAKLVVVLVLSSISFLSIACQSNNNNNNNQIIINDEMSNHWAMSINETDFVPVETFKSNTPFQKNIEANNTFKKGDNNTFKTAQTKVKKIKRNNH